MKNSQVLKTPILGFRTQEYLHQVSSPNWVPKVTASLVFLHRNAKVLLIRKRRGLGAGLLNGPGGHVETGETAWEAALREVREELGIRAKGIRQLGELRYQFTDGLSICALVFYGTDFEGSPEATAEAIPHWAPADSLPYDQMWEGMDLWMPLLLQGKSFGGCFCFNGDTMIAHDIFEKKQAETVDLRGGLAQLHAAAARGPLQMYAAADDAMTARMSLADYRYSSDDETPKEVFTPALVCDLGVIGSGQGLSNQLAHLEGFNRNGLFNFFDNRSLLPDDIDDTSLCLSVLLNHGRVSRDLVERAAGQILQNTNAEGLLQVYFPPRRHRDHVDPAVCANALHLLTRVGRHREADASREYVRQFLESGMYEQGTRYYPSPDTVLFFFSRLLRDFPKEYRNFRDPLAIALQKRLVAPGERTRARNEANHFVVSFVFGQPHAS